MEKMPYREELQTAALTPALETVVTSEWRQGLPTLRGTQVVLRELRASAGSPGRGAQRARQRRAPEDWRGSGMRAPQVVPEERRISRPGAVRRGRGRLARHARVGRGGCRPRPLDAPSRPR